jgi:hypothetical protein
MTLSHMHVDQVFRDRAEMYELARSGVEMSHTHSRPRVQILLMVSGDNSEWPSIRNNLEIDANSRSESR